MRHSNTRRVGDRITHSGERRHYRGLSHTSHPIWVIWIRDFEYFGVDERQIGAMKPEVPIGRERVLGGLNLFVNDVSD